MVNFSVCHIKFVCIDVTMCDLVHDVETISPLLSANNILKAFLKYD